MNNSSISKISLVVPCAGFGTRVGSPPAKELLPHPETAQPLIDTCLEIARDTGWNLVLITRHDKKPLMDYVSEKSRAWNLNVHWVLVQRTTEWPDSVLQSSSMWSEENLLILPDTDWQPVNLHLELIHLLKDFEIAYGLFDPVDHSTWGTVRIDSQGIEICEKPPAKQPGFKAWGLISFRRAVGKLLFEKLLESTSDHQVKKLPLKATSAKLKIFRDLTRPESN